MGGIDITHTIISKHQQYQYIVVNYGEIMGFVGKKVYKVREDYD